MNYLNDELIDALASRYVVGIMSGLARQRFHTLAQQHSTIKKRIYYWEQVLDPLNDHVDCDKSDAVSQQRCWQSIKQQIDQQRKLEQQMPTVAANDSWRILAAVASISAIVITVIFQLQISAANIKLQAGEATIASLQAELDISKQQLIAATSVGVITDNDRRPLWIIESNNQQFQVRATSQVNAGQQFDYELWFVNQQDGLPISLGVIPKTGSRLSEMPQIFRQAGNIVLAVSREPVGGSSTGRPTEVLYSAVPQSF